jgi:hypothetical protein
VKQCPSLDDLDINDKNNTHRIEKAIVIMKKKAGLWIDGGKAVIFSMADEGSEIKRISAITGEAVSSPGAMKKKTDGKKEGKLSDGRLKTYYDEVISYIRDAEFLLLFGPGNTKTELKKQLEDAGFHGNIAAMETTGIMTDNQVVTKVRKYFLQ